MSTLLLEREPQAEHLFEIDELLSVVGSSAPSDSPPGGLTLDRLITGIWQDIVCGNVAQCPVCGGTMDPNLDFPMHSGDCSDCGASLF
jgi:hypothetical protein